MSYRIHYRVKLSLRGPLLSQAPGVLAFGVDNAMLRYHDLPVISGSLVRGNIRHALQEFQKLLPDSPLAQAIAHGDDGAQPQNYLERWFGRQGQGNADNDQRAHAEFDFFWQLDPDSAQAFIDHEKKAGEEKSLAKRTRIQMEEGSGKVANGALQVIEDCFPTGTEVSFVGNIYLLARSAEEHTNFLHWLGKALDYIPAMGSYKGSGFGQLIAWEVTAHKCKRPHNPKPDKTLDHQTRRGITLQFDRPLCVGRPRSAESNRIVSDTHISGNVIKGVLARLYQHDHNRAPSVLQLDDLIVTHAKPVREDAAQKRHSPIPLSLALYQGQVVDMALVSAEDFIASEFEHSQVPFKAPTFTHDWKTKDEQQVAEAWGEAALPSRYLAIRTAINPQQGVAEENQLFTLECVDPTGYLWCADIELCKISGGKCRNDAWVQVEKLLNQGLIGIGKTKARAQVRIGQPFTPAGTDKTPLDAYGDGYYIVTLQTEARLLPPNLKLTGVNSQQTLQQVYQDYWHKLHREIKLVNYYGQQRLSGFYYHQVQKQRKDQAYYPEWLTQAGSVFVLQIKNEAAVAVLKQCQKTGLCAHPNADGSQARWETTPLLPENGYGEILINDPRQLKLLYSPQRKIDKKSVQEAGA